MKIVECLKCGEKRQHYGCGLCRPCHQREWRAKNRERTRAYGRRYYQNDIEARRATSLRYYYQHREERRDYQRRWEKENREQRNAYHLLRYYKHREEILASQHRYYERNKDRISAQNRQWKKANKEKVRRMNRLRKARKRNVHATLTIEEAIAIRSLGQCFYCGNQVSPGELTLDHLVPISAGGGTTRANIVAACQGCNSSKHTKMPNDVLEQLVFEQVQVCTKEEK